MAAMFVIIKKLKETTFEFPQKAATVAWFSLVMGHI